MKLKILIVVATLLIVGVGAKMYVDHQKATERAERQAAEKRAAEQSEVVRFDSRVEPNKALTWKLTIPAGRTPGTLSGTWSSQGSSAKVKGATDDSLVGFKLLGPNNETLQNSDHPTGGPFSVRISGPGEVTFVFDNAGILRSSARVVSVQGGYYPDKK